MQAAIQHPRAQSSTVRRSDGGSIAPVRSSRQAPASSVLCRIRCTLRLKPAVPTSRPAAKAAPSLRSGSGLGQPEPLIFGACRRQVPMSAHSPGRPRVLRRAGTTFRESRVRARVRCYAPPPRRGAESTPWKHAFARPSLGFPHFARGPSDAPGVTHSVAARMRRFRQPARGVQGII
jgi:hypothetical protein